MMTEPPEQQKQQQALQHAWQDCLRVRTITCFVQLNVNHFGSAIAITNDATTEPIANEAASTDCGSNSSTSITQGSSLAAIVLDAVSFLRRAEHVLTQAGYTVQTVRLATNPFGEWLHLETAREQLHELDQLLAVHQIQFCALGPATTVQHVQINGLCDLIVAMASERFSCSALLPPNDVDMAMECARAIRRFSLHVAAVANDTNNNDPGSSTGSSSSVGLANFRFTVAAGLVPYIPFFPIASSATTTATADASAITTGTAVSANDNDIAGPTPQTANPTHFSIGFENGVLARRLLEKCGSIRQIPTVFAEGMCEALAPLQQLCRGLATDTKNNCVFMGMDTSLNPSLDKEGSVAAAMECLTEISRFGGPGTLAAAATITQTLQSLPGIQHCGYAGLMLPVCEDVRLAELTRGSSINNSTSGNAPLISVSTLLSISQVCGVGVDTVPVPGHCTEAEIASVLLDVAGVANRWKKCLSCRIFPVVGKEAGECTTFVSPFLINASILPLS